MDELRVIEGSADQIPAIYKIDGVDQTSGFKVKLVPFETGAETVDLTDGPDWRIAPAVATGYAAGYYCVYVAIGAGTDRVIDHAGHVRVVDR